MAAADKCNLHIPYKDYLIGVDLSDPSQMKRAASQEFENYKAIERRINDPNCEGSCTCVAWNGDTNKTASNSDTITLSATTAVTEDASYWTERNSQGAGITPPAAGFGGFVVATAGWYTVSASMGLTVTGTDPAEVILLLAPEPGYSGAVAWGNQSYLIPSATVATVATTATFVIPAGEGFTCVLGIRAPTASTRSVTIGSVFGYGSLVLSVQKICGCIA